MDAIFGREFHNTLLLEYLLLDHNHFFENAHLLDYNLIFISVEKCAILHSTPTMVHLLENQYFRIVKFSLSTVYQQYYFVVSYYIIHLTVFKHQLFYIIKLHSEHSPYNLYSFDKT